MNVHQGRVLGAQIRQDEHDVVPHRRDLRHLDFLEEERNEPLCEGLVSQAELAQTRPGVSENGLGDSDVRSG